LSSTLNGPKKKCKELLAKLQVGNNGIFTKILVAIDGSKESMDAANYGIYLAKRYKSSTTILHILPREISYGYDNVDTIQPNVPASPVKGIVELSKQEAEEKWFSKITEKANQIDVQLHTDVIVATRSIAAEIVDYAQNANVDLIIVGTRGRSGLKRMLLGSVASGVVSYAHCPVMVVK
jgi:nucleotide-binding universal stress UspA family protein